MKLPWFRRNFISRRWLDRCFLDIPDAALRTLTGRTHWPPYSLRAFVGGARNFEQVGAWFLNEFKGCGLFSRGDRVLDIGCGCGRLAYALATDSDLIAFEVTYVGMDVDASGVRWCARHITPENPKFTFFQADCFNASYNPHGKIAPENYRFPFPDGSFNTILFSSVLTHVLAPEMGQYIAETARLLAPGGRAYTSFFLYKSAEEAAAGSTRHGIAFPFEREGYALHREDYPSNAVAYQEDYVRAIVEQSGLCVREPTLYGIQDVLYLTKPVSKQPRADSGEAER